MRFYSILAVIVLASAKVFYKIKPTKARDVVVNLKQFFLGMSREFYQDSGYIVDETCMDETTVEILNSVGVGIQQYSGFMRVVSVVYSLGSLLMVIYTQCNVMPFVYDVYAFCLIEGGCTTWNMLINASHQN